MSGIFLTILNMSITAGVVIILVLVLRLLLKRAPKWISVLLWGLAAVRLCVPFTVESSVSLLPKTEWISPALSEIPSTPAAPDAIVLPAVGENVTVTPPDTSDIGVHTGVDPAEICAVIWLVGFCGMLLYTAVTYVGLRRKVGTAVRLRENIFQSENVASPFVLGVIRPKIYLPFRMTEETLPHVIAHEEAHIHRGDHLWKPLGFLLLTFHWFNPLCWVGYILLCRDIEEACDERVIRTLGTKERADYSEALLSCSIRRRSIAACPLAFGEVTVKERVKNVLNYKKPTLWVIAAAVILCVIAAVCLLTDPAEEKNNGDLMHFAETMVKEQNRSPYSGEHGCFADVEVLDIRKKGDTTVLYTWALYMEYAFEGELTLESGSHIPTVITVAKSDGVYTLLEYWTPRDGSDYSDDIREKYPLLLWGKAMDSVRYYTPQAKRIREKAEAYFGISEVGGADLPENIVSEVPSLLPVPINAFYGRTSADIDGDGTAETLSLGMGRTSGLFSFTLTAYEGEVLEYERTFITEWYDLSFIEEDGTVKVQGVTQDEPPLTHVFDIVVEDGVLDLVENGISVTVLWERKMASSVLETTAVWVDEEKYGESFEASHALPYPVRKAIFTAYFGDRAEDVVLNDSEKDIWQLGKGGEAEFHTYHTLPTASGSKFLLMNRNAEFNFLEENRLSPDEPANLAISEADAKVMCHTFLTAVDPRGVYQSTGTVVYGKVSPSFYAITYERIPSGTEYGVFDNFLFYVTSAGIGYVSGEYVTKPPVTFTAVIKGWSELTKEGYIGTLEADLVDYVTAEDTALMEEHGLTEEDLFPTGYCILNPEEKETVIDIPEGAEFVFYDWGDDFKGDPRCDSWEERWVVTRDMGLFTEYLATYEDHPGMPFVFRAEEGFVRITEIFLM